MDDCYKNQSLNEVLLLLNILKSSEKIEKNSCLLIEIFKDKIIVFQYDNTINTKTQPVVT